MYSDLIHSMNKQTKTGKTDEGREIIPICLIPEINNPL